MYEIDDYFYIKISIDVEHFNEQYFFIKDCDSESRNQ